MSDEDTFQALRTVLARTRPDATDESDRIAAEITAAKDQVRARYAPMFSPGNIKNLDVDGFRGFLLFKNNRHWSNLQRQAGWMTADMPRLREALALLVDESIPLRTRLNRLRPGSGEPMVKGLARSVITAILQIVYPDKYGVLNNTTEAGMREVGAWPEFDRGATFADKYEAVNEILLKIAAALEIDLWTLDTLWWRLTLLGSPKLEEGEAETETDELPTIAPRAILHGKYAERRFGLERHLHDFLVDNWSATGLGKEWDLLEEDGEITGSGYNTREVGEIDLLAKHKVDKRWLVVELKRGQSSDDTVGQVLRYMGWVRKKLASDTEVVEGLIICHGIEKKMQYALDGQPNIKCMTYQVSFTLNPTPEL